MNTNMIRKGAAIASGLALAGAGLVAAPAQATSTGLLFAADGPANEFVGVMGSDFYLEYGSLITGLASGDPSGFITATVVPKSGQTASVAFTTITDDDTQADLDPANAANGTITIEATDNEDDNAIAIGAPTNLTESVSVDIFVTDPSGTVSETERVTFIPADEVTASLTVTPAQDSNAEEVVGTLTLNGINTGNYILNNTDAQQEGTGTADNLEAELQIDGTTLTSDTFNYSLSTDSFVVTDNSANLSAQQGKDLTFEASINSVEINKFFNSALTASDAATATHTLSADDAYKAMEIGVDNEAAVHNSTGSDTSFVTAEHIVAPEGTKSLTFTISAFTDTAKTTAAASGLPITVTLADNSNALGDSTVTTNGKTLTIANDSISFAQDTNSAGKIAFTTTITGADDGESFTINAEGTEDGAAKDIDATTVLFEESAMTALPAVDGNFTIAPGDSLSPDYTVIDQFGTPADSDYQLVFTRTRTSGDRDTAAEYANWSYVAPISADGTASVTIVDNGAAGIEGVDTVTATVQQKASSGSGFVAATGATNDTFTLTYENDLAGMSATAKADYDGIANAAGDVIHPLKLETKTLVNYDSRIGGEKPKYVTPGDNDADGERGNVPDVELDTAYAVDANVARVFGEVTTSGGVGVKGVAVRLSADGMNFSDLEALGNATRLSNDSIVVFTDATGSYETFIRSGVPGVQTITVDAQGTTATKDVRFQATTGAADALELSVESSVSPGARADIVATVTDSRGAPVSGVTVNFTDNGPGVLNAANAVTDIFGEARVTLTTLKTESGTTSIRAFYQVAGLTEIATATINVGVASSSADAKVNAGSFKGYVAVYALGYEGQRLSAKIGNDWVIVDPIVNNQSANLARVTDFTGAGVDIAVRIYIDRVLVDTIPLTTK